MTRETLRELVAEYLGLPPERIGDADNLILTGMTSMTLMKLANQLRRDGWPVRFSALVRTPTLDGWWAHLEQLRPQSETAPR
jgi:aryl carrier-like protein